MTTTSNDKEKVKPYNAGDLYRLAVEGKPYNPLRVLATYADPDNWDRVYTYDDNGVPKCHWTWKGPTITGYELAGWGLKG